MRYSFSGHETFFCKSLWLKKGYDFLKDGNSFNNDDAVVKLGVGKNMVSSIRYWLKAFGLTEADQPTVLADFVFDTRSGKDAFLEDINTLWLLHYCLVSKGIASIYNLLFVDYQREKKEFDRDVLNAFIKRRCNVPEQKNVYNENTVKKDIGVMLHNYLSPDTLVSLEDFSGLLISLNLLRKIEKEVYAFNETSLSVIDPSIMWYAILDARGNDTTISFDKIQDLALTFGMSITSFIEVIRGLEHCYPRTIHYSETSGVRNIQFTGCPPTKFEVLKEYYSR